MNDSGLRVQLLLTGNEIMSGDTVDSNSALIARRLGELSITVARKVTLGDDRQALIHEMTAIAENTDLLIVNGGLGPTVDDLTAEVLAAVAGVPLSQHSGAITHLQQWCSRRNLPLNTANRKQAMLPAGCTLIANPVGSAVGFEMAVGRCRILCTPGVPGELQVMLDEVITNLAQHLKQRPERNILRLQTFGLGESGAQQMVLDNCPNWPAEVELGFRAGAPQLEIKLTVEHRADLPAQMHCRQQLEALFGDHIIGEDDCQLAERVLGLLRKRKQTLTTAESCTGGLIASMLTRIPGSSEAFHAGFVTYANPIKALVLGVSEADLAREGAVSETVVRQMALGAIERAKADYVIAVSGIAGPDGGSANKPVGTVWLAWGSREHLQTTQLLWPLERSLFQTMVAATGLDLIRRQLLGIPTRARYMTQRLAPQKN